MNFFKRVKIRYILHRYAIQHALWHEVITALKFLDGLSAVQKAHLKELSTLFLHQKNLIGINFELTEKMRVIIAAQACLPILHLGLNLLSGWLDVLIYPSAFWVSCDEIDSDGVVHHQERLLSGEAWAKGPIILSWQDIESNMQNSSQGHNVIIHEIAHKLDGLNGKTNGMPPLPLTMSIPQWTATLSQAYEQLQTRLQHHHRVCVNPYAASSPAEFFAVFSEYFFCAPDILQTHFSDVYAQLCLYYRQDPWYRQQNGVVITK
ncbi:MAG: M90 family metallopeptidase [Methylococcaceae bacterium]